MRKIYQKGFTLIELMIVITVIAILAAIVLFGLGAAQKNARDVQRAQIMKGIQVALQQYASDNIGGYPAGAWAATTAIGGGAGTLGPYLTVALTDPGCGTPPGPDVRGLAGGSVVTGGCTAAMNVTYSYVNSAGTGCPVGSKYNLTLNKEGGGAAHFCAPQ